MTEEEMNQRFALLAEAVSRVADASSSGIRQLVETGAQLDDRIQQMAELSTQRFEVLDDRIRQLVDVQLATQHQMGTLSQIALEIREETRQLKAGYEQQQRVLDYLLRKEQEHNGGSGKD